MESILLIAGLVSLLVQGLRKLPLTAPLWQRIPDGYRWAPPLVLAFLGTLTERLLDGAPLWPTSTVAALSAVVLTWLASMGVAAGAKELTAGKDSVPPATRSGGIILLFFGILASTGCAGSFEEARLVAPQVGATADRRRCEQLDDRRVWWGGAAKGSLALAGATGLAAVPATSHRAEVGLAAGGVAAAAVGATAVFISESAGDRWVEECR